MAIFKQKPTFIDMSDIIQISDKIDKVSKKEEKTALEEKLKDKIQNKKPLNKTIKKEEYKGSDILWLGYK